MGTSESPTTGGAEMDTASGVHVELVVGEPGGCPLTEISEECGVTIDSVSWGTGPDGEQLVEFTMPADTDPSECNPEPVYTAETKARYHCSIDSTDPCACEFVRSQFGPISDARATHGQLHLTFFAPDTESVRAVVAGARESFENVRLNQLTRSGEQLAGEDPVVVDRGSLTERQKEVLETAHEMGYYDHPKDANATEVAAALDISQTTFTEHLAAAQRKLLGELFREA